VSVTEPVGLRERKRQRTHDAISSAAISLFLAHGFDQVSVADVADAAEVSKPTLFKYFATKEDLVLHRIADHQGEAARVVRQRPDTETPLVALRRHFLDGLKRRDPVTGLNDVAEVLAFHRMVFNTPGLAARVASQIAADEQALADALAGRGAWVNEVMAKVAAAQIAAVTRTLAQENWSRLAEGRTARRHYPEAVLAANRAFDQLAAGLGAQYG
jgi:AcrR family transcriptional regulator